MKQISKLAVAVVSVALAFSVVASADTNIKQVKRDFSGDSFIGWVPDRIIVQFKDDYVPATARKNTNGAVSFSQLSLNDLSVKYVVAVVNKQFKGATRPSPFSNQVDLSRYYKVSFLSGADPLEVVEAFKNDPNVESAEPIGMHRMYATPNDGFFSPYQWYHTQASDHDIDSPEAWDVQTGSSGIIVADLDSGTRYYHPDLGGVNGSPSNPGASRGNMWTNSAELNGTAGVDDDGNGYVDDWIGYDFIASGSNCWPGEDCSGQDNDPRDFNGHGTHTSGIVAMITNDGYGMAGVAGGWGNGTQQVNGNGVRLMALRMGYSYNWFGQEVGIVLMDAAAEAFYYAANNGAKIATCSWGSSNSGGLGAAVNNFLSGGRLIFVAAGNDGSQTADYLNGRGDCISVAATDQNDAAASFTTYGTWVDISAPGVGIYSTYHDHNDPNTNYWASLDGTSMATPMAAAVGALIWSQNPSWTAGQVEAQLYSSADNIDAFLASAYIGKMGAGRINSFNAVNTGGCGSVVPVASFSGSPTSGTAPLAVQFTDASTNTPDTWSWDFGDGGTSTAQNPNYTYSTAGTYTVTLTVSNCAGSDQQVRTNYISVSSGCTAIIPVADFSGSPTSGTAPLSVQFTDASTNTPDTWSWDFGDGGTSTAQNPNHTYASAGTYTVTLTASNCAGSDQLVRTNYISVSSGCTATIPVADFSGTPTTGDAPLAVQFTDASTNTPDSWSWDFGDGGTSTAQNPSYTYSAAGTYTVTLTASNCAGSDQLVRANYISVNNPPGGSWTVITYDDFESGWGSYQDGGRDCKRYTGGTHSWQGIASADIQDNSGVSSSFYHKNGQDVSGYTDLDVTFYFKAVSMENGEDFWLQYYDGSSWLTLATWTRGVDFDNNAFYVTTVSWNNTQVNFPTNAKLRFRCDASGNRDDVYIDAIEFRGAVNPVASAGTGITKLMDTEPDPLDVLGLPEEFEITQNYPNPFNPSTKIGFNIPEAGHVQVKVYNMLGQLVATLLDADVSAGANSVEWDASGNSSGVYLYSVKFGEQTLVRKMTLLK